MGAQLEDFSPVCRTFVWVSLSAIRHNGLAAKRQFPDRTILSVLKADAYGHGIEGVMPACESFSDYYAVATVEEGLSVRARTKKPVLLFGPVPEAMMALAARMGLTFTVGSTGYARQLAQALTAEGLSADCHLKIETGLNRSGVRWRDPNAAMAAIRDIHSHKCLRFTGMTARRYGLKGKGFIREGIDADLLLFDYDSIIDHADFMDPFQPNEGIHTVYLNGVAVLEHNEPTGIWSGKYITAAR